MNYTFDFPVGMDRDEVIHLHRLHDTCMHCGFEPPPEDCAEFSNDFAKSMRRSELLKAIDLRRGGENRPSPNRFSSGFIAEQAAARYFMLLDTAHAALKGNFSEQDFSVILNAECTPVWQWDPGHSVAAMVADDNGIESLEELPEGGSMRSLIEKLIALTPLENAALVDACERVWRGYGNPLLD
jgi:hypothetical protein